MPSDAAGVAQVHTTGWREAYGELLPERFYDEQVLAGRQAMWERALANPDAVARTLVAEQCGKIVGFSHRGPARDADAPVPDELSSIYILSEVYGTGIGQALLDALLGDSPAMLWVAKQNPRAQRFYEKNGFTADGREQTDPDLDGLAEVRMVRR